MFCSGGDLNAWADANKSNFVNITMEAYGGTHTEVFEEMTVLQTQRGWSLVIAPYDCEAAYILTTPSVRINGPLTTYTYTGGTFPGGQQVVSGINFIFNGPTGPYATFEKTDMSRYMLPAQYLYGSWYGAVFNLKGLACCPASIVDPIETTEDGESYKVHSPHGDIALPDDGYWPELIPESFEDAILIEQQPVRALFSYQGDGLYFEEEGVPKDTGGYPLNAPGIAAIFIGGA
jgi:hypothetical protein